MNKKRVALLATGDELIKGDILNTNGQYFTQQFIDHGIEPGNQIIVGDDDEEIKNAINFLLQDHSALITIGGLGPTADDRTRYGLAAALTLPLEFNEEVWQWSVDKLKALNLDVPDSNRQQALLPKGSQAIHNTNGTAAACYIQHNNKDIFMLPGPSNECFPIFNHVIIQTLLKQNYAKPFYKKSWLLFGVSESSIAQQLESIPMPNDCVLGYRVSYPYLEIKLFSANQTKLETLAKQFYTEINTHVVSTNRKTASQQLIEHLISNHLHLNICDQATGGLLESKLISPRTVNLVNFACPLQQQTSDIISVQITGLEPYWQEQNNHYMPLAMHIHSNDKNMLLEKKVPNRGKRSLYYAIELICWELLKQLTH